MSNNEQTVQSIQNLSPRFLREFATPEWARDQEKFEADYNLLARLTDTLQEGYPNAVPETRRFIQVASRSLEHPVPDLTGCTVVVIGGTGCVGSPLVRLLAGMKIRLVVVSRGLTRCRRLPGVYYRCIRVNDYSAMAALMAEFKPQVVFHLAAVRDPGQAEHNPVEAIVTNVLGTYVVVQAAMAAGVERLVYASTGKAVRFITHDVYAASKQGGEAIVSTAAPDGIQVGIVRFTHIVDNSLLYGKLLEWLPRDQAVRLHHPYIALYAQSALESAELLLQAAAAPPGDPRLYALSNLEHYFDVLELTLGTRSLIGSRSPVCFTGFPPGYASEPHPALYDRATAGDFGPLLNSIEARTATVSGDGKLAWTTLAPVESGIVERHLDEMRSVTPHPDWTNFLKRDLFALNQEVFRERLERLPKDYLATLASRCGDIATTAENEVASHLIKSAAA